MLVGVKRETGSVAALSPADEAEFNRRAQEVAVLLRSAGVPVLIEL